MVIPLDKASARTCGGKAATLGRLRRAGYAVPDGFVIPYAQGSRLDQPAALHQSITEALSDLGNPTVAVRSSAADEDTEVTSAAGRYESILGVRGPDRILAAARACVASSRTSAMAVLVQELVPATVSGVLFTPVDPQDDTVIDSSWGLGPSIVGGIVTPDHHRAHPDGQVTHRVGTKLSRVDTFDTGLGTTAIPTHQQNRTTLDRDQVAALADLGRQIASDLGGPQDIEWALVDDQIWVLQSRPITAPLPPVTKGEATTPTTLAGTPGSQGIASGPARIVRGPADFTRVQPGDILICPHTSPAWTPLLKIVAGVVTETGGVLSHAAIVAREHGIPAVLGLSGAMSRLRDGSQITIDGTAGAVTVHQDRG